MWECFAEFPYQTEGDRANAIALLLTPFLRHYIVGSVPLGVIEAPTPGTGKTLIARTLLGLSTPGLSLQAFDERERGAAEEWGKMLAAALSGGPSAVLLDNLRGTISSSTLESLLTANGIWRPRKFGTNSETLEIDISGLTMAATGNNAQFPRDMARRCFFIRLDAGVEAPDARSGFRIADLDRHIREQRPQLLADVLVILRAWIDAGRPEGQAKKGSFERWAAVLSGVLDLLGVRGFLASDADRAADADAETLAWRAFFSAWWEAHKDAPCYAKDLHQLAAEHDIIPEFGSAKALGRRLQAARDRVFVGYKITAADDRNKVARYALKPAESLAGLCEGPEVRGLRGLRGLVTPLSAQEEEQNTDTRKTRMYVEGAGNPANPANPAPSVRRTIV